jgi:hypothetical protein
MTGGDSSQEATNLNNFSFEFIIQHKLSQSVIVVLVLLGETNRVQSNLRECSTAIQENMT